MATEKELRDRLKKEKAKVNDKTKSEKIKSLAKKKIKSIEDELAKIGGEVVKDTKKVVTKGKDLAKMTDKEFEKAKDDLAKKLGKSEEECEEIIKKFKEQREKAKRSRKKRTQKLQNQGNTITPKSTEKSAEKTLLDTSEVLGDKIQKQIDGFESEAKRDARKKVKDEKIFGCPYVTYYRGQKTFAGDIYYICC